jgi:hypothetical protein
LWIGPQLGPIAAACLRSFARVGHRLVLHVYDPPSDVPVEVELEDASRTIPRDRIFRHSKTGSFAAFADLFRYELLANGAGIYVDCDVYCVRPLQHSDYLFGLEDDSKLNGAVLALPPSSPMLEALRGIARTPGFIPPWFPRRRRIPLQLRKLVGAPQKVADMRWGAIGPEALTYYAREFGVADRACPPDVLYPLDFRRVSLLFDPDLSLADLVTKRTTCIHLYAEMIRRHGKRSIPPTSPLGRMLKGETLTTEEALVPET